MPEHSDGDGDGAVVTRLCREVTFPVAKWLVIVAALDFGLDAVSVGRLHRMPDRRYTDRDDLDAVYRSTPALLPSIPPPGNRSNRVSPVPTPGWRAARR